MGAEPWIYFVAYQDDYQAALETLKETEFRAGRYYPVNDPDFAASRRNKMPKNIDDARELADADGTKSILDIDRVGDESDFGVVRVLDDRELAQYFGTVHPTQTLVETNDEFLEDLERGQGVCFVVFADGRKAGICFAGYSCD